MNIPLVNTEIVVVVQFSNPQGIVIPKRDIFARGICCFAAGSKQIPRRKAGFGMTRGLACFAPNCTTTEIVALLTASVDES
jgi:hypothetical protein